MKKPFYITTPIYYVNDVPHLGHAYTTIAADALARFHAMVGDDVLMLTGTDEHGEKVQEAAGKRGQSPQALCDDVAPRFAETWTKLDMGPFTADGADRRFIRTTEQRHKDVVATLWRRIAARDREDLYLATYQGWYCVGCEAFYKESDLEKDGETWICATHKRPVAWLDKERSWFFRMSKYGDALLAHIERHPHFIQPENFRNEVVSFIKSGLRDLSVSRTSFAWGIPVPEDDPEGRAHVIYVWMDALTNYISALGGFDDGAGGEPRGFATYWRSSTHLIGKDILRFHAVYWPCFLLAAGLPLPRTILCHGWWTIGGRKISKSIPATRVDPVQLAGDLGEASSVPLTGTDALKYFLLRETPLGNDGDLIFENLLDRYNADLANDLGNLINRSLTMVTRFAAQAPPARDAALATPARTPSWRGSPTRPPATPAPAGRPSRRRRRSRRPGGWSAPATASSTPPSRGRSPRPATPRAWPRYSTICSPRCGGCADDRAGAAGHRAHAGRVAGRARRRGRRHLAGAGAVRRRPAGADADRAVAAVPAPRRQAQGSPARPLAAARAGRRPRRRPRRCRWPPTPRPRRSSRRSSSTTSRSSTCGSVA